MLEKYLAQAAAKVGQLKKMPIEELVAMLGKKGKDYAGRTAAMVKAHPGESAGVGGIGAALGASLAGGEKEPDGDEDDMLRAYGLRR